MLKAGGKPSPAQPLCPWRKAQTQSRPIPTGIGENDVLSPRGYSTFVKLLIFQRRIPVFPSVRVWISPKVPEQGLIENVKWVAILIKELLCLLNSHYSTWAKKAFISILGIQIRNKCSAKTSFIPKTFNVVLLPGELFPPRARTSPDTWIHS